MTTWLKQLRFDPLRPLQDSGDTAIELFARQYLLDEPQPELHERLARLPEVTRLIGKQAADGAWRPAGKDKSGTAVNYALIETWKKFRVLVGQYELGRTHECVARAAEFIWSCQSDEGDIRGFLADQYAMYYSGALLGLLVSAGYGDDPRAEKCFRWLLETRQQDGGWLANPLMGADEISWAQTCELTSQVGPTIREWDRSKPFCLNGTGMVLRAFAAHPQYRQSEAARAAATLLKQRFFTANSHSSYRHPDNWLVFQYPYWWNNLVAALDAVTLILPYREDEDIRRAAAWLVDHQQADGLWQTSYSSIHKKKDPAKTESARLWISLTICRILKRIDTFKEEIIQ